MAWHRSYTTPKVEEWRSVDLAELRRLRMLDPTRIAKSGKIPALTWKTPERPDQLGVIAKARGVLFVRRDDGGQFGRCSYLSFSPPRGSVVGVRGFGAPVAFRGAGFSTASIVCAAVNAVG